MILTFTPNPALDIFGSVKAIFPNEKAYVTHEFRSAGGNGVNAGRIAHLLGAKVLLTGFLGGSFGVEYKKLIRREALPHQFIAIKGDTRINVTVATDRSHEQTRLSYSGPKILKPESESLLKLLRSKEVSMALIGGSLPPGIDAEFIRKMIRSYRGRGVPSFVDVPGLALRQIIKAKPYFIKPNLIEFQEMTGSHAKQLRKVLIEARKFAPQVFLQCISSVEGGAILLTQKHSWFGRITDLKIQSTVGAGDAMVGAMAYFLSKKGSTLKEPNLEEMLRMGLAASASVLSRRYTSVLKRNEVTSFYSKVFTTQID